jgi:hypothetical protein
MLKSLAGHYFSFKTAMPEQPISTGTTRQMTTSLLWTKVMGEKTMEHKFKTLLVAMVLFALTMGQSVFAQNADIAKTSNECKRCITACESAIKYGDDKGTKFKETNHMRALRDCVKACQLSEDYLNRGSELNKDAAKLSIQACNKAAISCESLGNDLQMKATADDCRRCAEALKKVSAL